MKSMGEMRKINTRNNVINIIRTLEKASKFQIQKISKYSMTTILSTIEELNDSHLIMPAGKGVLKGGRRPDFFSINPDGGYFIGFEFNIHVIHIVILNFSIHTIVSRSIPLEAESMTPELLIDTLCSVIKEQIEPYRKAKARIFGIGIGAPGIVDHQTGTAVSCHELPSWRNIAIRQIFEDRFGIPTYVDSYINMLARGCRVLSQEHPCPNFVLFSIRNGIRVRCILNQALLRGSDNCAGDIGQTPILPDGRTCSCGHQGCLDAEVSNLAVRAKLLDGIQEGHYLDLFESVGRDPVKVGIVSFVNSVLAGHAESSKLLDELCDLLSIGLSPCISYYSPPRIVIYGEITRIGQPFLDRIKNRISQKNLCYDSDHIIFELTDYNKMAGASGAALMVMQNAFLFVGQAM